MDVRAVEAARARRHGVRSPPQEASDLPPLVPSYHGSPIHLVFLHGIHIFGQMVCGYELLCTQVRDVTFFFIIGSWPI